MWNIYWEDTQIIIHKSKCGVFGLHQNLKKRKTYKYTPLRKWKVPDWEKFVTYIIIEGFDSRIYPVHLQICHKKKNSVFEMT